jgi:hypothetical protein
MDKNEVISQSSEYKAHSKINFALIIPEESRVVKSENCQYFLFSIDRSSLGHLCFESGRQNEHERIGAGIRKAGRK